MRFKVLILATSVAVISSLAGTAHALILTFNSATPASNVTVRASWLASVGISTPTYLEDFETGYSNGMNIHGVSGLLPGGLIIRDTSVGQAIVRSGAGVIGGSNPVGVFALTHNEAAWLELDFTAQPVDYLGFQDIDQAGTSGLVWFAGMNNPISFETTGVSGNTAEFFGIYRNDMPQITRVQFDASGDGRWGIDNLEYGAVVPEPTSLVLLGFGLSGLGFIRRRSIR